MVLTIVYGKGLTVLYGADCLAGAPAARRAVGAAVGVGLPRPRSVPDQRDSVGQGARHSGTPRELKVISAPLLSISLSGSRHHLGGNQLQEFAWGFRALDLYPTTVVAWAKARGIPVRGTAQRRFSPAVFLFSIRMDLHQTQVVA